jgi:hypothetical protein
MYSGGGYTVLQQMLIDQLGEPFPEILREKVLRPDGMRESSYRQPLPKGKWGEAATGYRASGREVRGKWHVYPEMAAAGLWTTPADLSRFVLSVERAWEGKPKGILSQGMAQRLLTRQSGEWGLGFHVGGTGEALWFSHSGGNEGFRCYEIGLPALGEGAVIMTNSDAGSDLISEILRGIAVEYGWPVQQPRTKTLTSLGPETLKQYVGRYQIEQGPVIAIVLQGQRLEAEIGGEPPLALYPTTDGDFVAPAGSGAELTFRKDERGRVAAVRVRLPFGKFEGKRLR